GVTRGRDHVGGRGRVVALVHARRERAEARGVAQRKAERRGHGAADVAVLGARVGHRGAVAAAPALALLGRAGDLAGELEHVDAAVVVRDVDVALVPVRRRGRAGGDAGRAGRDAEVADLGRVRRVRDVDEARALAVPGLDDDVAV